ncbi:MAG: YccF domain-containing protein [Flavisolibacter sp.]|nr:YccF domain-containing protein [Flavisolibacter sp.]
MNTLGNLIWLLFGGFFSALGYVIGGIVLCLTVVGIPFGLQCFKLAGFILWPFGREAISTSASGGCLVTVLNIIWIIWGGLWVAVVHVVFGLLLYITIIGIPFGKQHFKLVEVSLMPFGKRIVEKSLVANYYCPVKIQPFILFIAATAFDL